MDNPYYTCESDKTIDNSKQKCDKYLPFSYTPENDLDLGQYKITLSGKDKADNSSSETTLTLNITILSQITTPQEKKIIEEGTKTLKPEEKEKIKQELEVTKPTEQVPVSALEKAGQNITQASKNFFDGLGSLTHNVITGIGNGIAFVFDKTGQGLALTTARNGIANLAFAIGEKTDNVSHGFGTAIIKIGYLFVPEPTRIVNVKIAKSTPTSMTVTWETNHPANGKVNYGLTADYGQDIQSDKRITKHEFTVTGLKPNTTYFYEVMSQNRNYVYDANHTFTTPAK